MIPFHIQDKENSSQEFTVISQAARKNIEGQVKHGFLVIPRNLGPRELMFLTTDEITDKYLFVGMTIT